MTEKEDQDKMKKNAALWPSKKLGNEQQCCTSQ